YILNPVWLVRNVTTSWRHRASAADFIQRMLLVYSSRLLRRGQWRGGVVRVVLSPPARKRAVFPRARLGAGSFVSSYGVAAERILSSAARLPADDRSRPRCEYRFVRSLLRPAVSRGGLGLRRTDSGQFAPARQESRAQRHTRDHHCSGRGRERRPRSHGTQA